MFERGVGAPGAAGGPTAPQRRPTVGTLSRLVVGLCGRRSGEKRASRSDGQLERAMCCVVCDRCLPRVGRAWQSFPFARATRWRGELTFRVPRCCRRGLPWLSVSVPYQRAQRGVLGRACRCLLPAMLHCVAGGRAMACVLGHCVRNGA